MTVFEKKAGKVEMLRPAVFSCGCGSVGPEARRLLRFAGSPDTPLVMTSSDDSARWYIADQQLQNKIPALAKRKHSVLYNPFTKRYINLLNAPITESVIANVKEVVAA